jgi:transposase InsO family protein
LGSTACLLDKEYELKMKNIMSGNGSEFLNTNVEEFLDEEGIKHEFSAQYTPQQNDIVENKNRTLIDAARTMLDEYKTPDIFWAEAINTSCHAINRLYLHKYLRKTPYKIITSNKPKVHYFRVFGVSVSYLTIKPKAQSLHQRLMKAFYLVMILMNMPIVSSTKPPVVLRSRWT